MKSLLIVFFITFLNFVDCYSEEKIYFVSVDLILKNSNAGKETINKLNDLNKINISGLKKKEVELQNIDKDISKVKNIISETELNKKIIDFKKKVELYQLDKKKKVEEFNLFKKKELEIFFNNLTPQIEEFMEKNSINIIIDKKNIFIANSKYDITERLINYLDNNSWS